MKEQEQEQQTKFSPTKKKKKNKQSFNPKILVPALDLNILINERKMNLIL